MQALPVEVSISLVCPGPRSGHCDANRTQAYDLALAALKAAMATRWTSSTTVPQFDGMIEKLEGAIAGAEEQGVPEDLVSAGERWEWFGMC